jgi:hypothetical protein
MSPKSASSQPRIQSTDSQNPDDPHWPPRQRLRMAFELSEIADRGGAAAFSNMLTTSGL